jgi:L-seryl-tRNA(Ser) seleniumtransferase
MPDRRDPRRELPAVDRLLAHRRMHALLAVAGREYVVRQCRVVLGEIRMHLQGNLEAAPDDDTIVDRVERRLAEARQPVLTRVINASGTILHTNLGRALLAGPAIEALRTSAASPIALEYDLSAGGRGRRERSVESLLLELTGCEAATVVNNNAAAVLLALNTLANGKEVIVSRGELIEIGGAFRMPDIMAASGAILREVGTTNRTHPSDYERAITDRTGLLLKVHTSNYRIVGFTSEVGLTDIVDIGRRHTIPVLEDLGSGALLDLSRYGLPREPVVAERIRAGADVVTFSGDKVLGGPQAGLIVGRRALVDGMMTNPLHRALRCSKLTIAALEATLQIYLQSPHPADDIPTLRIFTRPLADIERIGVAALKVLRDALGPDYRVSLQESAAQVGSGALPTEEIPSLALAVEHSQLTVEALAARFRRARPAIIGRVKDDRFLLDLRTIFDPEDLVPHDPAD